MTAAREAAKRTKAGSELSRGAERDIGSPLVIAEAQRVVRPAVDDRENKSLPEQISDLRHTLESIRGGGVDAVVLGEPGSEEIHALVSTDRPSRLIIEDMQEGALTVSSRGVVLFANRSAGSMLGSAPHDLVGRAATDLFALDSKAAVDQLLVMRAGDHAFREAILAGPKHLPVVIDAMCLDLEGTPVHCFILNDLTERKDAEAALRASEEHFRSLIQYSSDIILVVDAEGVLTFASPAAQRVLGYDPASMLGTRTLHLVHPDDVPQVSHALAGAAAQPGVAPAATYRVRHASGEWRWIESISTNMLDDPIVAGVVVNARDVTEHRQASDALEDLNRVLRTIMAADVCIVHGTSEQRLLEEMCRVLVEDGGYLLAWIGTADTQKPDRIIPMAASGDTMYLERVLAAYGGGPVLGGLMTTAIQTGATQIRTDFESLDPRSPLHQLSKEHGVRSQIALPLEVSGELIGAISIHATSPVFADHEETRFFEQLAEDLAYGIGSIRSRAQNEEYFQILQRNIDALLDTVAATAEARDPYTAGHQRRVAGLAAAIGEELGLDSNTVAGIRAGATIHDIGKISIPSEILTKPTKLTPLEFELIKQHPQAGYDIARRIEFPWPVARMIIEHHERLDGSGYPNGLRGDQLLAESRIIAVADVVESMSSHRPYRAAKGIDAALTQIEHDRGTLLDASAVDACMRLFRERQFAMTDE